MVSSSECSGSAGIRRAREPPDWKQRESLRKRLETGYLFPPEWPPLPSDVLELDGKYDRDVKLSELFFTNRLPALRRFTIWHVLYLLTFPLWVAVGFVRFTLLVVYAYCLYCIAWAPVHKRDRWTTYLNRYLVWPTLGIFFHVRGRELANEKKRLIVCNHISNFDSWVFRGVFPLYALVHPQYDNAIFIRTIFHQMCTPIYAVDDRAEVRERIISSLENGDKPLVLFPEGGITTGRKGTLMFHKFVFSLGLPICPVTVTVKPALPMGLDTLLAGMMGNTFWLCCCPWYSVYFDYLPPMTVRPPERPEEFARRVQRVISHHLGIQATPYMYSEKVRFVKKVEKRWPKWKRIFPFPVSLISEVEMEEK